MKNKIFIILSLFFLELNAQTTKKIEICFFDNQNKSLQFGHAAKFSQVYKNGNQNRQNFKPGVSKKT